MDLFSLPVGSTADQQTFWPTSITGVTTGWQTWYKPRGKTMLQAILIGGGGGGGGGCGNIAGSGKGGGGGGGSSGATRILIPLAYVPDNLYVMVGQGGVGGAGSTGGAAATTGGAGLL